MYSLLLLVVLGMKGWVLGSGQSFDQRVVTLKERVLYFGTTQLDGVQLPQLPYPPPPSPPPGTATPPSSPSSAKLTDSTSFPGDIARSLLLDHPAQVNVTSGNIALGFKGIDLFQERYSGSGPKYRNTQFSNTPPDVSFCVGNGFVVQIVNTALAVYDTSGKLLAGVTALNQFFGTRPAVVRNSDGSFVVGDRFGDSSCVYDKDTKRFFLSSFWLASGPDDTFAKFGQTRVNPETNSTFGAGTVVAVSSKGDPTMPWKIFFIPGTNDGINSHDDTAPPLNYRTPTLLQDYPQIGVDAYGVFLTTDQFGLQLETDYFGSNIYAMSKRALIKSTAVLTAIRFALPIDAAASVTYNFALIPAKVQADGSYDYGHRGTTYFGSKEQAIEPLSSVAIWAITNTKSLGTRHANPQLHFYAVTTPEYNNSLFAVPQKPGPIPVGASINDSNVEALIRTNPGFMHGCSWGDGKVWLSWSARHSPDDSTSALVAAVTPIWVPTSSHGLLRGAPIVSGLHSLHFSFQPSLTIFKEIVVPGEHLLFPSVAVNSRGKGLVAFSMVGPDCFPSTAFIGIDNCGGVSIVVLAGKGEAPLDVFDGYSTNPTGDPGTLRYGDWQYAAIDEEGNGWGIAEYVNSVFLTKAGNWATFIFKVTLSQIPPC